MMEIYVILLTILNKVLQIQIINNKKQTELLH